MRQIRAPVLNEKTLRSSPRAVGCSDVASCVTCSPILVVVDCSVHGCIERRRIPVGA
jgi:hypothetical protein